MTALLHGRSRKKDLGENDSILQTLIRNMQAAIALAESSATDSPKAKAECAELKMIVEARLAMLKAWTENKEVSY